MLELRRGSTQVRFVTLWLSPLDYNDLANFSRLVSSTIHSSPTVTIPTNAFHVSRLRHAEWHAEPAAPYIYTRSMNSSIDKGVQIYLSHAETHILWSHFDLKCSRPCPVHTSQDNLASSGFVAMIDDFMLHRKNIFAVMSIHFWGKRHQEISAYSEAKAVPSVQSQVHTFSQSS